MDPDFIDGIMAVDSVDGLYDLIAKRKKRSSGRIRGRSARREAAPAPEAAPQGYQVLAVTACPTGIAHTYMAAESLEQHASRRGISIKVETNGQSGVKNA
jgi:fructose PTS system EIIBC or EIIC component